MKYNLNKLLLVIVGLLLSTTALAHNFEVDGIYYNYVNKTDKTVAVTYKGSYYFDYNNEYTGSVIIPSSVTYNGTTYSVTSIGSYAFSSCTGLTSVNIPNSVISIGNRAFEDCTGLTEVNYNAENCTSMGSSSYPVFSGCSNLKTLNIGNEVKNIPPCAFYGCTGLTSVTIGNSVTSIGYEAFDNCTGLTEVNISDLSAWCKIDFNYSANPLYYAKKLKLNGSEIKDLVIPNDITEIKKYAFNGYYGLTSVTIPNSVTKIGGAAFSRCYGLTEVTIPNSVTSIGSIAFRECSGLTSVTIGNSVTSIGSSAFECCKELTSVVIGKSVKTIGEDAFYLTYLQTIISLNSTPPICVSGTFEDCYATLYVPKDSYAKYFIDDEWGEFLDVKKIETLVSSIKLNNTIVELDKGSTATLTATITPSNATINDVIWESSNPQVAKVDQSGIVTALSAGTATITATAVDGSEVSTSCKVVVKGVETKITLSQTEVKLPVNDIMTLTYTVAPSNTPVEWSTSNSDVAYLKKNSDGSVIVVGMSDGEAIVTARATDGSGASASCKVIVGVGVVEGVEVDENSIEVSRYDIHGRLITEPTKGVNIVIYTDGTTRKEIVE